MTRRRIGLQQHLILEALIDHERWSPGCGWIWGNRYRTVTLLDSLVRRGLVTRSEKTMPVLGVLGGKLHTEVEYRPAEQVICRAKEARLSALPCRHLAEGEYQSADGTVRRFCPAHMRLALARAERDTRSRA